MVVADRQSTINILLAELPTLFGNNPAPSHSPGGRKLLVGSSDRNRPQDNSRLICIQQDCQCNLNVRINLSTGIAPRHINQTLNQMAKLLRRGCRRILWKFSPVLHYSLRVLVIPLHPSTNRVVSASTIAVICVGNSQGYPCREVSGVELDCASESLDGLLLAFVLLLFDTQLIPG